MSRCIVKQSVAQPTVSPVAQVAPMSVLPAPIIPVSVSPAVETAPTKVAAETSGLFTRSFNKEIVE